MHVSLQFTTPTGTGCALLTGRLLVADLVVSQRRQLTMAPHPSCKLGFRGLCHVCKLIALAACLVERPVSLHYTLARFILSIALAQQDPSSQKKDHAWKALTRWHFAEQNHAERQRLHVKRPSAAQQLPAAKHPAE